MIVKYFDFKNDYLLMKGITIKMRKDECHKSAFEWLI